MVETRPVGCGLFGFWVVLVVLVLFSTITLFFPFNDDLGTMPTRRPYSGKKKGAKGCNEDLPWGRECNIFVSKLFRLLCLHRLTLDQPLASLAQSVIWVVP